MFQKRKAELEKVGSNNGSLHGGIFAHLTKRKSSSGGESSSDEEEDEIEDMGLFGKRL